LSNNGSKKRRSTKKQKDAKHLRRHPSHMLRLWLIFFGRLCSVEMSYPFSISTCKNIA
jgi:hypothetical protein